LRDVSLHPSRYNSRPLSCAIRTLHGHIRATNLTVCAHVKLFNIIVTVMSLKMSFCTPDMRKVKVKIKCTLVQVLKLCTGRTAHRGISRGIALLFFDHGNRKGEGSASYPGRYLLPGKTRYPLYRRLCGPLGRSVQVRKISHPPRFDPQAVQPVASGHTN